MAAGDMPPEALGLSQVRSEVKGKAAAAAAVRLRVGVSAPPLTDRRNERCAAAAAAAAEVALRDRAGDP